LNLWPHQTAAVEFAASRTGTMLSCGMGTGKTRMALALRQQWGSHRTLVVAPLGVVADDTWGRQARDVDPTLAVHSLRRGSVADKAEFMVDTCRKAQGQHDVMLVINWDAVRVPSMAAAILKCKFDLLVFDESHRAKSHDSMQSRTAWKLVKDAASRGARRLCLTGTPMPHSPLDIFAQMRLVDDRVFGTSYYGFKDRYAVFDKSNGFPRLVGYKNRDDMARRMASVTFEVDRSVLKLPDAHHVEVGVHLDAQARKMYVALQRCLADELAAMELVPVSDAMVRLLRLQQFTSGYALQVDTSTSAAPTPYHMDFDEVRTVMRRVHNAKQEALVELLEDLGEEPVVVFCRFKSDLEAVHSACNFLGLSSLELSGSRKEQVAWKEGKAQVLAVQIRAGAEGVDLTRAAVCIYYSLSHSLGDYEQSLARVHRPGQSRPVRYFHLVVRDTVDEVMRDALAKKANVIEGVMACLRQSSLRQKQVETNQ